MKRLLNTLFLGVLFFTTQLNGQVEFTFESASGPAGGTVDMDVTVTGFNNISTSQFSTQWDSTVMTFNSVVFTNPDLAGLNNESIGTPDGSVVVDEGQFTLSYNNPNLNGMLDNGSVMFTIRFDLVGEECDETSIVMTNTPTVIETTDENFNSLDVTSVDGLIMITGPDCGNTGGDLLTLDAGEELVFPGEEVCVPINVLNFAGVQSGSGTILWDQTVITYNRVQNSNLTGFNNGDLNTNNVDNGELRFVWANTDPSNPVVIDDGDILMEICFDAIGEVGDMSDITLSDQGSLGFEWFDDDDNTFDQSLIEGKVTITENVGNPVTHILSDAVGAPGDNVCVDVSVQNFENIATTQYEITWDGDILSNPTPTNFDLSSLNINSFNVRPDSVALSWSVTSGIDVNDNTVIYSICFDISEDADCPQSVDVFFTEGDSPIEIGDGNFDPIGNTSFIAGSVSVECPTPCEVVQTSSTCAGVAGGSIVVNVPTEGCTYSWANSTGEEVSQNRNLTGALPGTYFLTVTCDGEEVCTVDGVISELPSPILDESITNAACDDDGSITVEVTGGSGNYSFNWDPAQPNSNMISDLAADTYSLTVTDTDSNCSSTAQYEVGQVVESLGIESSQVSSTPSCEENGGSISITATGGCDPYSYSWSDSSIGNTPDATGLSAGSYMVTVTDSNNPANTVEGTFMVGTKDAIVLDNVSIVAEDEGMSNGSIDIDISGGSSPYSYNWSGPTSNLPDSDIVTGLMGGDYTVVVTDSDGCMSTFGPYTVPINMVGGNPPVVTAGAVNNEFGFGISCNGFSDGSIAGNLSAGDLPVTVTLGGDGNAEITLTTLGTFSFDDLPAGTYSVTAVNDEDQQVVSNIEITEPDEINVEVETGCDNNVSDGFIDLTVTGGSGEYTFDWGNPDLVGASLDDLEAGDYPVTVEDENGCMVLQTIEIELCDTPIVDGCYEVRDVITPNGDNVNDNFVITCVQDFPSTLEVYDRWGALVYNQAEYDGRWEGIDNSGEMLPEGGYMYILRIEFGQGRREIMRGTVTILRN